MSEIFEGVVCPAALASVEASVIELNSRFKLAIGSIGEGISVVYRTDPRSDAGFSGEANSLGAALSGRHQRALLVRYDSRIGHRSSILFESGVVRREFGEDDELFVPLDEDGMPMLSERWVRVGEFLDGEEYETVKNSIQLGLGELGVGDWGRLFALITGTGAP